MGGGGALSRIVYLFRELLLNQSIIYTVLYLFFFRCNKFVIIVAVFSCIVICIRLYIK